MDLIKIACIMLAVAFFLGILTSGIRDETPAISAELESETVSSDVSGVAGTVQAEKESATSVPVVLKPAPDPLTLEKGESKMAAERKDIERKVRATVRLIESKKHNLIEHNLKITKPQNEV